MNDEAEGNPEQDNNATASRWGRRFRRFALAWHNALEIAQVGRLSTPYGAPYEVVAEQHNVRLRHYQPTEANRAVAPGPRAPLLLVPPLMIASEVYDIAPDVSAVACLQRLGVDVWLIDFGAPEREAGGMERTLDDHVRAVSDAIDQITVRTGQHVHLAGYSQGGMFCYQAAAFRRSAHVASVITFGSPVNLLKSVELGEGNAERLVAGLRTALAKPLAQIDGLPGAITSTGFKLLGARKEVGQLIDFVRNLHDRQALERREARRLFLRGQGFVAWPGPAFRKFVDELVVGNRMAAGGFVIDGRSVSLADLTCPVFYVVGDRDEMGRPAAVRGIREAAPRVETLYELDISAGHFGLVVGSTAQKVTWPAVAQWMCALEQRGEMPAQAINVREAEPPNLRRKRQGTVDEPMRDLEIMRDVAQRLAHGAVDRLAEATQSVGAYVEHARFQLPRLSRLKSLGDHTQVSLGRTVAEQAERIPMATFFMWRGRAFTYADANRRVDAVVRGLIAVGVRPGVRVGVLLGSRPTHLSLVTALNRLGAVAVLLDPETTVAMLPRCLALGDVELVIADPERASRARAAYGGKVLAIGGVGDPELLSGHPRLIPAGVTDMELIDPATVTLPSWYRPNPGRAAEVAMIFVSSGATEPPRALRVTNRRWAFSALGAAAACTLTGRDTIYCCLPLHHPSGMLVAVGASLIAGTRLALASHFEANTFWEEVRRYGVTVVFYAHEMCRTLVDAPYVTGEKNNPVRLFAGSGMRADVWRRITDRFGPVGVLEFYASTEANAVLANTSGRKIGALGRALPGSPELVLAAWDFDDDEFVRDAHGHLLPARVEEPGMLVARLDIEAGADLSHIDPKRLLREAFVPGDIWFVTGDFLRVDVEGDHYYVGPHADMVRTPDGIMASLRIEDALYQCGCVRGCVAFGRPVAGRENWQQPVAAVMLREGAEPADALAALSRAALTLPAFARPQRLLLVETLALNAGFRFAKHDLRGDEFAAGPSVFAWDAGRECFVPT